MYAGTSVEKADRASTYYRPHHPYTRGLLASIPSFTGERVRLTPIPGTPPSLINLPSGCAFHPRCSAVMDRCLTEVPPLQVVGGAGHEHRSACFLPAEGVGFDPEALAARTRAAQADRPTAATLAEVLVGTDTRPEEELAGLASTDVPQEDPR